MTKFPLTTAGAQDLINELYALPQAELQIEADAAGADFRLWIKNHFELTETQIVYLDGIDQRWIDDAQVETKYFLENRLPIALFKDQAKNSADGDRGKLLDLDKRSISSFSEQDGFEKAEKLDFTISYPNI
ncbi:hypothetical protein [Pedobacter helvus]|uniref:Uncharacterized protein n=1 Tax=Pedobacter helvus TaxID=2563444 RepID=A0ABW9JMC4_9SPHI|nr:hypothetical protein [Pedobacter ureilyticus]